MAARSPDVVAAALARPLWPAAANAPAGTGSVNASIPTTIQRLNRTGLCALVRAPAISRRAASSYALDAPRSRPGAYYLDFGLWRRAANQLMTTAGNIISAWFARRVVSPIDSCLPRDPLRPMSRIAREGYPHGCTGSYTLLMATRAIHLPESSYALLSAEAQRRGLDPDALADELLRTDLATSNGQDLDATLQSLAELRARLPEIDGVVLARDARAQLEQRGSS